MISPSCPSTVDMLPYPFISPSRTTLYPAGHFVSMRFNAAFRCADPIGPPRSSLNKYVTTPPVSVSCVSCTASEQAVNSAAVAQSESAIHLLGKRKSITRHDLLSPLVLHKLHELFGDLLLFRRFQNGCALFQRRMSITWNLPIGSRGLHRRGQRQGQGDNPDVTGA